MDNHENSHPTVRSAIQRFINPKRFVMLGIFALVCSNSIIVIVNHLSKVQVLNNAKFSHSRIFTSYEQAVERNRKLQTAVQQGLQATQTINSTVTTTSNTPGSTQVSKQVSPWWTALRDISKEYPAKRMKILLSTTLVDNKEKELLETLKNRPRGYTISDEEEGWARSFYLLPTKNAAALTVYSYVKDELTAWREISVEIGICSFFIFVCFGWFWTRALESNVEIATKAVQQAEPEVFKEAAAQKVRELGAVIVEMGPVLEEMKTALAELEQRTNLSESALVRSLEDVTGQIHLLAVNGSIEAVRSLETQKVFHSLMQDINQLAMKSRRIIGKLKHEDRHFMNELHQKLAHFEDTLKKVA